MDTRYQVFVSSTYKDLQEERAEVIRALLEMNCIPAGMELFPASDEAQFELIKRVIDDCDYYIVIIGGRYGSTDEKGMSYTEKEFDYAVDKKIPVMVFPIEDPNTIPVGKAEIAEKAQARLAAFREKATKDRMVKSWTSPQDLAGKVSRSLIQQTKIRPAEGWVRGRHAGDAEAVLKLKTRIEELEAELQAAQTEPPIGTEELAQGEDRFVVNVTFLRSIGSGYKDISSQWSTTWNQIVAILGPLMFDECSELALKTVLESHIEKSLKPPEVSCFQITQECFQTIKVQLIALGLIRKSERKRAPSDGGTYWTLTPYGERYTLTLKAIRRS